MCRADKPQAGGIEREYAFTTADLPVNNQAGICSRCCSNLLTEFVVATDLALALATKRGENALDYDRATCYDSAR